MNEPPRPSDQQSEQGVSPTGEGLRLQLYCPKCNTASWVEWRQLPHLLRCRGCFNSFWIDKSGHVQSEHEVGVTRVECPRCHQARQWPKGVAVKRFSCLMCGYDFSSATDSSAASLGERLAANPQGPPAPKKKPRQSKPMPPAVIAAVVAGALLVFCLPILALVWGARTDRALIEAVQAFNAVALAGDAEKAKQWVPASQATAFDTWMLMNTSNRPLGQFVGAVEVQVVQYSSSAARVTVSYQRTIQDRHEQCQCWERASGGRWEFDPAATLQRQE
jgi:hypothetical protein